MGLLSKLFEKKKLPIKEINEAYTRYFTAFSKDIIELLQKKGFIGGTADQVRIEINDAAKFGNIIAEYALFLKAVIVYTVKQNLNDFSLDNEIELNKAFTILDQLTEAQRSIPRYKKVIDNRVNDYISAAENKKVCGYSAQNVIRPQNYTFIQGLCTKDHSRFSLMFADCVYYILKCEDFATQGDLNKIKDMAKNETSKDANTYMDFSHTVVVHADLLSEEIKKILINR